MEGYVKGCGLTEATRIDDGSGVVEGQRGGLRILGGLGNAETLDRTKTTLSGTHSLHAA